MYTEFHVMPNGKPGGCLGKIIWVAGSGVNRVLGCFGPVAKEIFLRSIGDLFELRRDENAACETVRRLAGLYAAMATT